MTLPANVRVNVQFPFPAIVKASAPVTITKQNGIWTIGFTFAGLGTQVPPLANYPTDFVLVYDSVAKTFFQVPLSALPVPIRGQRSVIAGPVVVASTDQILNLNLAAPTNIPLPAFGTRLGQPLTFKDVGGVAGANNVTLTANGADTIDGSATFVLRTNFQGVTLMPFNDGVNTGWAVE